VKIPVWLAFTVAAFVTIFGVYRIRLAFVMTPEQEAAGRQRGGLYGAGKRFHLFVGVVYILMGAALTAMALGWQPLGGGVTPASDTSPDKPATP
jgi:hypothetical protein